MPPRRTRAAGKTPEKPKASVTIEIDEDDEGKGN